MKKPVARGGFTMVEILVTFTILSVGVLAFVGSFGNISKSIQISKTRVIATNLAQEKIESLKDVSYYRLVATTSSAVADEPRVGGFLYDTGYYPEEPMNVAGINFIRRVYVEKVQVAVGDTSPQSVSYLADDTGLKRVKAYVLWEDAGGWRSVQMENLLNNPGLRKQSGTVSGTVTDAFSLPLDGAVVSILQNSSWYDQTNNAGAYSFTAVPGTYTLRADMRGYFPSINANVSVAENGTYPWSPQLSKMSSGTVTGSAFIRDHLVISQVVGSTVSSSGFSQEYVEVFNPTTWTWTINGQISLKVWPRNGSENTIAIGTYNNNSIAPFSYYLFANAATVSVAGQVIAADAVWESNVGGPNDLSHPLFDPSAFPPQLNAIPVNEDGGNQGSAVIKLVRTATGDTIDKFGWRGGGSGQQPPDYEGTAFYYTPSPQNAGLNVSENFYRRTHAGGHSTALGPAYDTNVNDADFIPAQPMVFAPRSAASGSTTLASGTPASGAIIGASDGLSSPVSAASDGSFSLTSLATGTWVVLMSSGSFFQSTTTVITAAATVALGGVGLTGESSDGYVTGTVTNADTGGALSGIQVEGLGAVPAITGANGRYQLTGGTGTVTIVANPGNLQQNYISLSETVAVSAGRFTTGVDFSLSQGGRITGRVYIGANALPGVPVTATDGTDVMAEAVTDAAGGFTLANLSTGTAYTIQPQLEAGETYSPSAPTVTLDSQGQTKFSSTFTVSNAFGWISGAVTYSGQSIQSGVLVIATTATISGTPPDITSTIRSGVTKYYATSSLADGTYTVNVPGGNPGTPVSYNVYGWYTTFNGTTPTTTPKSTTASVTGGAGTSGRNLSWP